MIYIVQKTLEYKGKIYQPKELIQIDNLEDVKNLGKRIKKLEKRTKVITDFKTK